MFTANNLPERSFVQAANVTNEQQFTHNRCTYLSKLKRVSFEIESLDTENTGKKILKIYIKKKNEKIIINHNNNNNKNTKTKKKQKNSKVTK